MNIETIVYPSSGGRGRVSAALYTPDEAAEPKAILQISHGMCEYIGRYETFAKWLCDRGFAVCGNDHLGHKNTALLGQDRLGYFGPRGSYQYLVEDLELLRIEVSKRYPGVPCFLLGHSMGSFIARLYAARYGQGLAGFIISGTAGKNPMAGMGKALAAIIEVLHGPQYESKLLFKMSNGGFNKSFDEPVTPVDWLTRDSDICKAYCRDTFCNFRFTVSAYYELFTMIDLCNRSSWYEDMPKNLPVFVMAGDKDPVGNNGEGPTEVAEGLRKAGLQQVQLKLYPQGRHEMLNETNKEEVYENILQWMEHVLTQ